MKKPMFHSVCLVVLSITGAAPLAAAAPNEAVRRVLEKYRSARPAPGDLTVYCLDWVSTLQQAKEKAVKEQRPIFLAVVSNSFGNLFTGHC